MSAFVFRQLFDVTLLASAGLVLTFLFRRRFPHLVKGLWVLILLRSVLPPVIPGPSFVTLPQLPENLAPRATASEPAIPPDRLASTGHLSQPAAGTGGTFLFSWTALAGIIYLAGVAASASYHAFRFWRFRRELVRHRMTPEKELCDEIAHLSKSLKVSRFRLWPVSTDNATSVFGLWNPVLVISLSTLSSSSPADRRRLLTHELLHLRSHDHWIGALQAIVSAVWWFHPLVILGNRQLDELCEFCCDEAAVAENHDDPAEYSRTLVRLVDERIGSVRGVSGYGAGQLLKSRIRRMLHPRRTFKARAPRWTWFLLLIAGVAAFSTNMRKLDAKPAVSATSLDETYSDFVDLTRLFAARVAAPLLFSDSGELHAMAQSLRDSSSNFVCAIIFDTSGQVVLANYLNPLRESEFFPAIQSRFEQFQKKPGSGASLFETNDIVFAIAEIKAQNQRAIGYVAVARNKVGNPGTVKSLANSDPIDSTRAAMLLKFAESTNPRAKSIGISDSDKLVRILRRMNTAGNFETSPVSITSELRGFNLVYFEKAPEPSLLRSLSESGIVTVGNGTEFIDRGGDLAFDLQPNMKLRFFYNPLSRIKFSSQLLRQGISHSGTP